jgi:hypothetical protein
MADGKIIFKILIFSTLFLLATNIYIYTSFSHENLELKNQLMKKHDEYYNLAQSYSTLEDMYRKLEKEYNRLLEQNRNLSTTISEMSFKYSRLNASYHDVLEANRNLSKALELIANKLVVPSNYTLMGYYEFEARFTFAYNKEMMEYVYNATGGWDGSEEDFQSDLYKIYRKWRDDFTYAFPSPAQENLTFIMVGTWWYPETLVGDRYLKEVRNVDVISIPVAGAQISFKYKKGVCWDYVTVLVSLYYAYYDMIGRSLPTGYLSIGLKDKGVHHGCVIIKEHDDKIAIIDWDAITAKEEKITFLPFKEVKEIHEKYWNSSISYDGVMRRTPTQPLTVNNFTSEEEFQRWLIEEFN